jgi:hypothetical protein
MKEVAWELALSTAARLAPLREHYVTTRRHTDVASQLNMVLANREIGLTQFKADRKLGLLVVGSTGAGKTTLLKRLVADHPYLQRRNELHLPLISLRITAPVTNKSLAHQTLRALGFETDFDTKISAHKYWGWVRDHAEARDACGFLFDEGQDLFLKASDPDAREALSMLKGLMEVPGHPYVVVMSGGPELEKFIEKDPMVSERFYRAVLTPIAPNTACGLLAREMTKLAALAGVEFGRDVEEIAKRTIHASFNQFGRSLELVVDGIQEAAFAGENRVTMDMFADAYHRHTHCGKAQNIFLVDDSDWPRLSPIKVTKQKSGIALSSKATVEKRDDAIW